MGSMMLQTVLGPGPLEGAALQNLVKSSSAPKNCVFPSASGLRLSSAKPSEGRVWLRSRAGLLSHCTRCSSRIEDAPGSSESRSEDAPSSSESRCDDVSSSSESTSTLFSVAPMVVYPLIAAEGSGYSQASYYTSLGLFVISVPGIWSLVKRSTKSKVN
jgi:hypothetical protein